MSTLLLYLAGNYLPASTFEKLGCTFSLLSVPSQAFLQNMKKSLL